MKNEGNKKTVYTDWQRLTQFAVWRHYSWEVLLVVPDELQVLSLLFFFFFRLFHRSPLGGVAHQQYTLLIVQIHIEKWNKED